jgi:multicomponent Na+:H+ antiporter subunit A
MLLGAWRALRQCDLKLLLAYGTVSQLGFLTILVGYGSRETALAGVTLLVAHALFKSGLFLTVGTIDHATGTRDLRELSGLGRRMPLLLAGAAASAVSMAGLPPLIGFLGKEAAYAALLHPADWRFLDGAALVAVAPARCSPSPTAPASCGEPSVPGAASLRSGRRPGTAPAPCWWPCRSCWG